MRIVNTKASWTSLLPEHAIIGRRVFIWCSQHETDIFVYGEISDGAIHTRVARKRRIILQPIFPLDPQGMKAFRAFAETWS
jgi:hypothetical protein